MLFQVQQLISRLGVRQQKGQGLVEYALIIVLVSLVVIVALGLLGEQVNTVFETITTTLSGAGTAP